jgi:hypothetical protein
MQVIRNKKRDQRVDGDARRNMLRLFALLASPPGHCAGQSAIASARRKEMISQMAVQ